MSVGIIHTFDYTHTINSEALWTTQKQLFMVLTNGGIDPDHLDLYDLAAQVEVSKLRERIDVLDIFYMEDEARLTGNGEVEVYFHGFVKEADVMCLRLALT